MMNRTQETSRRPPMNYLDRNRGEGEKGGGGEGGCIIIKIFWPIELNDLRSKARSVDLGWLYDPVLHSSVDVFLFIYDWTWSNWRSRISRFDKIHTNPKKILSKIIFCVHSNLQRCTTVFTHKTIFAALNIS